MIILTDARPNVQGGIPDQLSLTGLREIFSFV